MQQKTAQSMKKEILNLRNHEGLRDRVFEIVLGLFDKKPIKIFQVGAIESFEPRFRIGSGWCDLFFGEYIKEYGGELIICDIDEDHLDNSRVVSELFQYDVTLVLGPAEENVPEDVDLAYLDGSQDPRETLKQFEQIDLSRTVVLVDDFRDKGYLVKNLHNFTVFKVANDMGLLDKREEINEH